MTHIFQGISFLFLIFILSFSVHATDLQAFIQDGETAGSTEKIVKTNNSNSTIDSKPLKTSEANEQFTHIIELVVAGIVASALIISVLVLFLGRWAGRREKRIIKEIRIKAEEEQENIMASAATVREQEKETTQIVHKIRDEAKVFSEKKEIIENFDKDVHEITLQAKAKKEVIDDITDTVNENVGKIKSYWDEQLKSTITTIAKVQGGLDKSLSTVDKNLDEMLQQKIQSDELLSDFIAKNNEQLSIVKNTSISSDELNKNLKEALKESTKLLKLLKKHQKSAEKSLNKFTEELIAYEEQAYEQFDTSFQVADLARQELNANIDESRKHIETMRRHEEQSHSINVKTQKNLKALDFTKIAKLSHTLDSTFSMFTNMTDKVDETRAMLDELNELKADISLNQDLENSTTNTDADKKPQPAKALDVKPEVPPATSSPKNINPLKVDLATPVIKATPEAMKKSAKTEIKADKMATTKEETTPIDIITSPKDQTASINSLLSKEIVSDKKPSVSKKSSTAKKKKPLDKKKAVVKEKTLTEKKPTKKSTTKLKKAKKQPTVDSKNKNSKAKAKSATVKSKGTAKPKVKPKTKKKDSIANAIEAEVEITSVLNNSKTSKTAVKTDNKPISFFTNVKKNKAVKKDQKKEPVVGSVKHKLIKNK